MRLFRRHRKMKDADRGAGDDCTLCGTPLPADLIRCTHCGSVRQRPAPPAPTLAGLR